MIKLLSGAAAAIFFAGIAFAGEPVTEAEIVDAQTAVEAVQAEADGEAEAVQASAEDEGEVGPVEAVAEEGVTKKAAAE